METNDCSFSKENKGKGLILLEVFDSVEPPIHREDAIDYAEAG